MTDTTDQRFAPPEAHVADVASGELVLAERGTRFLAAIVDAIVMFAAVWAVSQLPFLKPFIEAQTAEAAKLWSFQPLSLALGLAVFLLVQGWLLVKRGQTVGKLLFKLRITRPDGSQPEAWRLLGLRYGIGVVMNSNVVVSMIYSLLDCLLIFRESRKCLHDSIAGTQVVKL